MDKLRELLENLEKENDEKSIPDNASQRNVNVIKFVYELPAFGRLSAASAASPSGKVPPSPETAAAYPADSAASADAAPVAARTPKTKRFSCRKNLFLLPADMTETTSERNTITLIMVSAHRFRQTNTYNCTRCPQSARPSACRAFWYA